MSPRVIKNAFRSFVKGFRQGRTQGDPWQQGGAFVIAPGGKTVFSQVSEVAGDHADPRDLLRALDGLGLWSPPPVDAAFAQAQNSPHANGTPNRAP